MVECKTLEDFKKALFERADYYARMYILSDAPNMAAEEEAKFIGLYGLIDDIGFLEEYKDYNVGY